MKTETEIKDDLYLHLQASRLLQEVTGTLSKTLRPEESRREDVVISIISSDASGDTMDAIVNINVYVADLLKDGRQYVEHSERLRHLSQLSLRALQRGISSADGYRFELTRQSVIAVPQTHEHVINNRIYYQSLK